MLLRRLETEPARDLAANIAGSKVHAVAGCVRRKTFSLLPSPIRRSARSGKRTKPFVEREATEKGFEGRFRSRHPPVFPTAPCSLSTHLVDKLERPAKGGGRAAIILSGSPLFTGNAGQGESEIRRWLLENDYIEAIVALPTDIFFRTGIGTYVWILTNKKSDDRKGKVQLIDATGLHTPMRKAEGNKRRFISDGQIQVIARLYADFQTGENVRIVDFREFGYRRIKVQRPLRLVFRDHRSGSGRAPSQQGIRAKLDENEQAAWIGSAKGLPRANTAVCLVRGFAEHCKEGRPFEGWQTACCRD